MEDFCLIHLQYIFGASNKSFCARVQLVPGGSLFDLIHTKPLLKSEAVIVIGAGSALRPTPYTLNPEPFTLHPTPYTRHPKPYTLHPTPYTLHPKPYTLHPKP